MPKYAYQTFRETIVESKKNLYGGEGWAFGGGVPRTPGAGLTQDIDAAVDTLLARLSPDGWEPTEAIDARSLIRARHVTAEYIGSFLGLGGESGDRVIVTEVRMRFRCPDDHGPTIEERAVALDPNNAVAWYDLGTWMVTLGLEHVKEALAAFDRAVALDPEYADAWGLKGTILGSDIVGLDSPGRYAEALTACDRALALEPSNALGWKAKGRALVQLERFEEALAAFDHAIALDPSIGTLWDNRGRALVQLERFEEAVTAFDRSIARIPDDSNIWAEKGRALVQLERFEEALVAFDRSIALDPIYAEAWIMKGSALRRLGREAQARAAEAWAEALETQ